MSVLNTTVIFTTVIIVVSECSASGGESSTLHPWSQDIHIQGFRGRATEISAICGFGRGGELVVAFGENCNLGGEETRGAPESIFPIGNASS
ncbi:hypothetical protein ACFX1X_020799 [Malus domestica]